MNRRSFLMTASAFSLTAGCAEKKSATVDPDALVRDALDALYQLRVELFPEFATSEGASLNASQWNAADNGPFNLLMSSTSDAAESIAGLSGEAMSFSSEISRQALLYDAGVMRGDAAYLDHRYVFSHMYGKHTELPTFLINKHKVDSEIDFQNYMARLEGLGRQLDQYRERAAAAAVRGIRPPQFLYDRVIDSCRDFIAGAPFSDVERVNPLFQDAMSKLRKLKLGQEKRLSYETRIRRAFMDGIRPSYDRLIDYLTEDKKLASNEAGVWRLPDGEAYYRQRLRARTTTDMSPQEIHDLGLAEVARLRKEVEAVMDEVGFEGAVTAFFEAVRNDPRFYLPDTEEGRAKYRQMAEDYVAGIYETIETEFFRKPSIPLEVRRVEPFREKSAGKAFYSRGAPDGARPGIFYVNTITTDDLPTYMLEGRSYHEGVPGHHFQIATAQQLTDLPKYRRVARYTAYSEGWALYAERLAREMGFYRDPYSNFGRIARELWRATRLVTDTGIHAFRWSRRKAIDYLLQNSPHPEGACVAAVDRYCAMPGQATAYSIGMLKILELRARARATLGDRYDQREFHDAVIGSGPLPLATLEEVVLRFIERRAG